MNPESKKQLSGILNDLANATLMIEEKPDLSIKDFMNTVLIFNFVFSDQMFNLMEKEGLCMEDREKMAEKAGNDLMKLIKTYTDIDTVEAVLV